jgi:hypothetical protein
MINQFKDKVVAWYTLQPEHALRHLLGASKFFIFFWRLEPISMRWG